MRYILIFFITAFSYSQNYELTYEIVQYKELKFDFELNQEMKSYLDREMNEFRQYTKGFKLKVLSNTNNYYYFVEKGLSVGDKNQFKRSVNLRFLGICDYLYNYQDSLYYHYDTQKVITKAKPENIVNWEITDNFEVIRDYKVYKANLFELNDKNLGIIANNVVAWFSPEINLKGGPSHFANLPGLIIAYENRYVRFELTSIKSTNKTFPTLKDFVNGKKIMNLEKVQQINEKFGKEIESRFSN